MAATREANPVTQKSYEASTNNNVAQSRDTSAKISPRLYLAAGMTRCALHAAQLDVVPLYPATKSRGVRRTACYVR